jgi:hypothetical protein
MAQIVNTEPSRVVIHSRPRLSGYDGRMRALTVAVDDLRQACWRARLFALGGLGETPSLRLGIRRLLFPEEHEFGEQRMVSHHGEKLAFPQSPLS